MPFWALSLELEANKYPADAETQDNVEQRKLQLLSLIIFIFL